MEVKEWKEHSREGERGNKVMEIRKCGEKGDRRKGRVREGSKRQVDVDIPQKLN